MTKWNDIKEGLPPLNEAESNNYCKETLYVLCTDGKSIYIGYMQTYDLDEKMTWYQVGCDGYSIDEKITHWMRLPTLPKIQNNTSKEL